MALLLARVLPPAPTGHERCPGLSLWGLAPGDAILFLFVAFSAPQAEAEAGDIVVSLHLRIKEREGLGGLR